MSRWRQLTPNEIAARREAAQQRVLANVSAACGSVDPAMAKLATKVLAMWATYDDTKTGFDRHWRLVGPVETFCEQAEGALEQDLGNALRAVLEAVLRDKAPGSFHLDAEAAALLLGARRR